LIKYSKSTRLAKQLIKQIDKTTWYDQLCVLNKWLLIPIYLHIMKKMWLTLLCFFTIIIMFIKDGMNDGTVWLLVGEKNNG